MDNQALSRRGFLQQAALAASGIAAAVGRGHAEPAPGPFTTALGFQLYTLRNILGANPAAAFQALSKAGYTQVEVLRQGLDQLGPMLKSAGLTPVSGHFDAPLVTGNWEIWAKAGGYTPPPKGYDLKAAIAQAKETGLKYYVVPYLTPGERGGIDFYRKFADQLNQAGEACRSAGLKFCYHHHAFEFQPIDGKRPLDILLERTDKALVGWEVDVFWVSVAGSDPIEFLKSLAGRAPLIHLKDKGKGTPNTFSESGVAREAFKEVGNGVLDIPGILRAAAAAGVEQYFVEQDQCPGDPVASLKQSIDYLRKVNI
jgi:sugar phosphate isomerase/epimerase